MKLQPADFAKPIEVSPHSLLRCHERLRWKGGEEDIAERIRGEIRSAIIGGRVAGSRPNWTRPYPRESPITGDELFVWPPEVTHAWVIAVRGGVITVASVIEEYDSTQARAAQSQRLRHGLGYA